MCRDLLSNRDVRVLDAVRFYVEHAPRADSVKLGAAVTLFLAKKKDRVGKVHYTALDRSLRYLVDAIGVKTPIDPLGQAAGRVDNCCRQLNFFVHAKRCGTAGFRCDPRTAL